MNPTRNHHQRTTYRTRLTAWLLCGLSAFAGGLCMPLTLQAAEPGEFGPLTIVDGIPRLERLDVIYLADGGTIRGQILNNDLNLHTSYGSVRLETAWVAAIVFDQEPGHLDHIKTINRNRFSGFLNEPIELLSESGEMVRLQKIEMERIVFQQRADEAGQVATRRYLILDNGDLLSGQPLEWSPRVTPGTSSSSVTLDNIEHVQFGNGTDDLQILLRSGRGISADLNTDPLRMELDLGPVLLLPASVLRALHARTGSLPVQVQRTFSESTPTATLASATPPAPTPEGMVWIQPGRFQMGSYPSEPGHNPDEAPPTQVVITEGFWMGKHELTQKEYEEVMKVNPSAYLGQPNNPVEKVTWHDAVAYCKKRTERARESGELPPGFVYRLPTEAEWEYSCRAGSTTQFHFGDDPNGTQLPAYGWYISTSDSSPHPVGKLKPNPWGLYDMHGNVWEWCLDIWHDAYPGGTVTNFMGSPDGWLRVARGGSWLYNTEFSRSANRDSYGPDNRCSDIGFRIVLARPVE